MSTVTGNESGSLLQAAGESDTAKAAGVDTAIQYNNGGLIAGDANLTWAAASNMLTVGYSPTANWAAAVGATGALTLTGAGAGASFLVTPTSGLGASFALAGAGDFLVNTTQLVVDTSAARVGINTAAPNAALDVIGAMRLGPDTSNYWTSTVGATGALGLVGTGAGGTFSVTPTAGQNASVVLSTTGKFLVNTTQLAVDTANARVGVNTAAPNAALDVIGAMRLGPDTSNYWTSTVGATGALGLVGTGAGGAFTVTPTAGQNAVVSLSGASKLLVNTTQLVVDTANARVGVNTAAPSSSLDVLGTTRLGDHATNYTLVGATGDISQVGTASTLSRYASTAISLALSAAHVIVECTAASITITLPNATTITGRDYRIDNSSTGSVTVNTTSSQTIQGQLTQTLPSQSCMTVYSNGSNWRIF